MKPKIIIYSTQICPYCRMAKDYLKKKGLSFRDIDVSKSIKARNEMLKKSGKFGVPVIDINGKIILGFDVPKINTALKKNV